MYAQECAHVEKFEHWARTRHVRPTRLAPLWHVAGWALGAGTALLGSQEAMACTAAVEHVIDQHYRDQIQQLGSCEPQLSSFLEDCRQDEIAH